MEKIHAFLCTASMAGVMCGRYIVAKGIDKPVPEMMRRTFITDLSHAMAQ